MKTVMEFDYEKATQALNYIAKKEGGAISKLKAVKLIWLVDRYHIRKYGRPITNDTYFAMKYGPVGSSVKDLAECSDFLAVQERNYLNKYLECDDDSNLVKSIDDVDDEVFSESEIEALDAIFDAFGNKTASQLVNISHKYPEWKKFEIPLETGTASRAVMSYSDFYFDPKIKSRDFFQLEPEQKIAAKETFEENFEIANFWA